MSILGISTDKIYLLPLIYTVRAERQVSITLSITTQSESRPLSNSAELLKGVERLLFCETCLMRDMKKYDGRIL